MNKQRDGAESSEVSKSPDGRTIIVKGRRWRATDPSIPEALRTQLVSELMAARRAVKSALGSRPELDVARARVHDAKVALGERGAAWWDHPSEAEQGARIESTIRALLWSRPFPRTICPSEVARVVGGQQWRTLLPAVRSVAATLHDGGQIQVTKRGVVVEDLTAVTGPVRYRRQPTATEQANGHPT